MKTAKHLKTMAIGMASLFLASAAYAQEGSPGEQSDFITDTSPQEIGLGQKYGDDAALQYEGTRSPDGFTVLENKSTGLTISGEIDANGYGDLRDENGYRILKVRPR